MSFAPYCRRWHHKNLEHLQNMMSNYLYQSGPRPDLEQEIHYAWEKIKKEVDASIEDIKREKVDRMWIEANSEEYRRAGRPLGQMKDISK